MPRGVICSRTSKATTIGGGSTPLSATSLQSRQTGKPHNPVSTFPGEGRPLPERIGLPAASTARRPSCAPRKAMAVPSVIRTLKENLLWVRTFKTVEELRQALLAFRDLQHDLADPAPRVPQPGPISPTAASTARSGSVGFNPVSQKLQAVHEGIAHPMHDPNAIDRLHFTIAVAFCWAALAKPRRRRNRPSA